MSVQVFNNTIKQTETITSQSARVLWGVGGGANNAVPMYMLGLQLSFQQSTTPMYPLYSSSGDGMKLLIKGAPEGTLSCQGLIVKSHAELLNFIRAVTKECKDASDEVVLTIHPFGNGCNGKFKSVSYTVSGVDLSGVQLNIQAGQVAMITHTLTMSFTGLQIN